jgi:hypothetical protein
MKDNQKRKLSIWSLIAFKGTLWLQEIQKNQLATGKILLNTNTDLEQTVGKDKAPSSTQDL